MKEKQINIFKYIFGGANYRKLRSRRCRTKAERFTISLVAVHEQRTPVLGLYFNWKATCLSAYLE